MSLLPICTFKIVFEGLREIPMAAEINSLHAWHDQCNMENVNQDRHKEMFYKGL
jgi:hypothetical protein